MIDVSLLLWLAAVLAMSALAAILHRRDLRSQRLQRPVLDLAARVHRGGFWSGAWFVGVPATKRRDIAAALEAEGSQARGPRQIIEALTRAGAHLLEHQSGPQLAGEIEARGWLLCLTEDLEKHPVSTSKDSGEAIFALLYARVEPPPHAERFNEIAPLFTDDACIGVAFVACSSKVAAPVPVVAAWREYALLVLTFFLATMAFGSIVGTLLLLFPWDMSRAPSSSQGSSGAKSEAQPPKLSSEVVSTSAAVPNVIKDAVDAGHIDVGKQPADQATKTKKK